MQKYFYALLLFLIAIVFKTHGAIMSEKNLNEYIITETDLFTSLDPLDADQTQNLPVARMVYATPLEIDASDAITSLVLEKFRYDKKDKTIHWTVKKGLKYSDGQEITVEDVGFSVLRMLLARPQFPVIESIVGKDEWLKSKEPLASLPSGMKITGSEITIKLAQDYPHPLFRFCLELFSIIPKKCVDLKTNKISCEILPESGRYSLKSKTGKNLNFKKRLDDSGPNEITFRYASADTLESILPQISENSIIAGNESMYAAEELSSFRKNESFYYLPAARFAVLQISPVNAPFDDKLCREVFANHFRKEYEILTKDYSPAESSIFTKIVNGYLTKNELELATISKIKKSSIDQCIVRLRKSPIKWGYVENEKNSAFVKAFEQTLKKLQLSGKPDLFKTRKDQADKFVIGEISVFNAGSGFWANDPVGDLQMLFTPNLHKPLNFITKDESLQKLIKSLVLDQADKEKYFKVNKYLHDQAMFNVYTHVRRFYFSKAKNKLKQIPQGSAAPTPWQVFE